MIFEVSPIQPGWRAEEMMGFGRRHRHAAHDQLLDGRLAEALEIVTELAGVEVLGLDRATARLPARRLGVVVGVRQHRLHAEASALAEVAQHLGRRPDVALQLLSATAPRVMCFR